MFPGVRDDGYFEPVLFYTKYSKADAIDADGAFFNDQRSEFFREGKTEFIAALLVFDFFAGAGGIYMPLHKMPGQPACSQ